MARLTAAERKRLPSRDFADPQKREFPDEDPAHARAALQRVSEFGSAAEKAKVRRNVKRKYPNMKVST